MKSHALEGDTMNESPIIRLFDALSQGNIAAARACFVPEAVIWHGFDGIAADLETSLRSWEGLTGCEIEDVHSLVTAEGFVQQHVFIMHTQAGTRKAWHVCIVAKVSDGLITRLDEYMDRAGFFVPAPLPQRPGDVAGSAA
jgi:ketosteroid isomerase-like protein